MEDAYVINGGKKLCGEVKLSGAKNIALKTIIAALLFDGKVILDNIPRIRDVEELLNLIKSIGGKEQFIDKNRLEIKGGCFDKNRLDFIFASKVRVSFLFFAPFLLKFNSAEIPNPGGCRLGARSIDRIVNAMKDLLIQVDYDSTTGYYLAKKANKINGLIKFNKPTHTGTELIILLAVVGNGQVTIENAATEPEVDNLIDFLNSAGARIKRKGNLIQIYGVKSLKQKTPFKIASDRNEAATYVSLALATKGSVTISLIEKNYISSLIDSVITIGGLVKEINRNSWKFSYPLTGGLRAMDIETAPYPGFMTDWQPPWAVLLTQVKGESIIHERLFENRFSYVEELKKLGAQIEFIEIKVNNPKNYYHFNFEECKKYQQAIKITGPQELHGGVLNIADLRAGATLAIAALVAKDESVVNNVSILERGYENFVEKIQKLGGNIKKI